MYVSSKRRSKENIGPVFVEDGLLANRDKKKQRHSMWVLLQSLIILIGLGLPGPLSQNDLPCVDAEIIGDKAVLAGCSQVHGVLWNVSHQVKELVVLWQDHS